MTKSENGTKALIAIFLVVLRFMMPYMIREYKEDFPKFFLTIKGGIAAFMFLGSKGTYST